MPEQSFAVYRHEDKYLLSPAEAVYLRGLLRGVLTPDAHGDYAIRSLYFDNISDKALREKLDGVNRREKFRIRYYNGNTDQIHLEKKSKWNGLGTKDRTLLTADEAQRIVDGDLSWMIGSDRPLVQELYVKMNSQGLRPKTIVDYTR